MDFDVLLYTNTTEEGEAAAGGPEAYRAALTPLFDGLADPERQRAVIAVDGAPPGGALAGWCSGEVVWRSAPAQAQHRTLKQH